METNFYTKIGADRGAHADVMGALNQREDTNPVKLIVMLYDGCINYLNKAIEFAEDNDIKNKNIYTNKAGDIICGLNDVLNLEAGGEIAENLRNLYVFMGRHLVDSIHRKNTRGLREVIKMLSSLKDGWNHVAEATQGLKGNPLEG